MIIKHFTAYYERVAREWTKLSSFKSSADSPSISLVIVIMLIGPVIPVFALVWLLPVSSGVRIGIISVIILFSMILLPLVLAYKLYLKKRRNQK
jgi:hypothetical protein